MRKKFEDIYRSPDYAASQTNGPAGMLSSLFRMVMQRLLVGPEKWGYLMRRYVQDPRNGVPDNEADRGSTRGNLSTALSNDYMTWKVFIRGLKFLRIQNMRVVLELHTEDGKKEIIWKELNLNGEPDGSFSVNDLREAMEFVIAEEYGDDEDDETPVVGTEEPNENE